MTFRISTPIATLTVSLGVFATPAISLAQSSATELETIVVTAQRKFLPEISNAASKLSLPVIETPQALTVMSSEFLDIAAINDTAGVVAYTPGIELLGIGDGTQANLFARGFQVNRDRSFRINGLSADSESDLDYFAMDRVEFVRGPASSLYGESDYGATINRVLKSPTGNTGARVSGEFGSYDFQRVQLDGETALNDVASVRAVAAWQESDTFIRDTSDNRKMISPSATFRFGETSVLLQGYYDQRSGASSDGFPLIRINGVYTMPDLPRSSNNGTTAADIDSTNTFVFAGVDHMATDSLKLSFKGGYSRIRMDNFSTYLFGAAANGASTQYPSIEHKTKEDLSLDASAEQVFQWRGRDQRILVSADWRRNELMQDAFANLPIGVDNIFDPEPLNFVNTRQPAPGEFFSTKQYFSGVTTMAYFKPFERLSALLGMRYSRIESNRYDYLPTSYGRTTIIDDAKDHEWVPRAGLVFKLAENHNVFFSYSEGIVFNATLLRADRTPVNPETGVQYEVGFKGKIADQRAQYSLSAFRIERTDSASSIVVAPGQPATYINVGNQVHSGIEAELQGEIFPGFNLLASYAYLDVDVKESARPAEVGQTPPASPANSYSLFATYEVLGGPLKSLTFGGGVVGRSEREVNTLGTYQLPSYTRVDLRLSYKFTPALLLELNAQNVTNEKIYTSQYGSPDLGIAYAYPSLVKGRISYSF
jgi:iron complex outermembrane recepter protein